MKKIFGFFTLLLLMASCAKDADVAIPASSDSTSGVVSFSATMAQGDQTKAEAKTTWDDGEQIAIFVDGFDEVSYQYDINAAGVMSPVEGVEPFQIEDLDNPWATYRAFYPYNAALTTVAEYEAATSLEVDLMSSIANGADQVEFTFSHSMALLYFEVGIYQNQIAGSLTIDGETIELDFVTNNDVAKASAATFIEPKDDISAACLSLTFEGETIFYSLDGDYSEWAAGCSYLYNNLEFFGDEGMVVEWAGSGEQDDPYLISNLFELQLFVDTINDSDSTEPLFEDEYFQLTKDIDLGGSAQNAWVAIGSSSAATFAGTFDGAGYKISGLYIDSESSNQGFFGVITGATIMNLGVDGLVSGAEFTGAIVGSAIENSTIINCYNQATVSGANNTGGIVGETQISAVVNCYNMGDVKTDESVAGGIVGVADVASSVVSCYNAAQVSADSCVGSIVGCVPSAGVTITDCYNDYSVCQAEIVGEIAESCTITTCDSFFSTAMQSQYLTYMLNNGAYTFNNTEVAPEAQAVAWVNVEDGYSVFDFNSSPTYFDRGESWYGSGTQDDPYYILEADDFNLLATNVNGGTKYSSNYFLLLCDVDLGGFDQEGAVIEENEFTPIGEDDNPSSSGNRFAGNFDGNGFEVSGLYINKPDNDRRALFGFIGDATIENLTVSGSVTGSDYTAGVVGYAYSSSTLRNLCNKVDVEGSGSYIGGVVAYCSDSSISYSYNLGDISSSASYVGGVIGQLTGGDALCCWNLGSVSSTGGQRVGGIAGHSSGANIYDCYNTGSVSATTGYSGGIAGYATEGVVSSCYNTAQISAESYGCGGIIGGTGEECTAINCYNMGNIAGTSYVGGISGSQAKNYSSLHNCYSSAELSGTSCVGGITGYLKHDSDYCYFNSDLFSGDAIASYPGTGDTKPVVEQFEGKTTEELKSDDIIDLLNAGQESAAWKKDSENINNGYPILIWQ